MVVGSSDSIGVDGRLGPVGSGHSPSALAQSVSLFGAGRARILALESGLTFLAGLLVIGGSHRALELFG